MVLPYIGVYEKFSIFNSKIIYLKWTGVGFAIYLGPCLPMIVVHTLMLLHLTAISCSKYEWVFSFYIQIEGSIR